MIYVLALIVFVGAFFGGRGEDFEKGGLNKPYKGKCPIPPPKPMVPKRRKKC